MVRGRGVGREHDVRGQRADAGARATRVSRHVEGERVEVEHEAGASKRLDGKEPRKGDRRDRRVSGAKIKAGVNAKGRWVQKRE